MDIEKLKKLHYKNPPLSGGCIQVKVMDHLALDYVYCPQDQY